MEKMTAEEAAQGAVGAMYDAAMQFVAEDFATCRGMSAPPLRMWKDLRDSEREVIAVRLVPFIPALAQIAAGE